MTASKLHRENQALCSPILAVQLHTQNLTLLEPEIFLKNLDSPKLSSRAKTLDVVLPSLVSMGPLAWPQVKGFGIVNKAKVDVFLELSCFFSDPVDVGSLISGSSAFSK